MYPHINRSTWPKCWPNVKLVSCSVTPGHQMPLPGYTGSGDMSDDMPARPTGWPNGKLTWDASTGGVHLTEVHVTTGLYDQCSHTPGHQMSLHGGMVRLTFCLLGSQPASQLANCNWPASQLCDKISTCQALGWSDIWWQEDREPNYIGPQSSVPSLPLVPLGEWPTWPRPGKWHKWALQPVVYLLALCLVTICSFVSMLPNHIFLHTM